MSVLILLLVLVTLVIVPVLVPAFVLVKSVLAAAVVVAVLANAPVLVLVDGVVGLVVRDVVACAARVSIVIVLLGSKLSTKPFPLQFLGMDTLYSKPRPNVMQRILTLTFRLPFVNLGCRAWEKRGRV